VPLSLVKKAAAKCGLALVTLVLAPLAGLVFGLLLAVAFLIGKGGEESGSALGVREELHNMIEALPDEKVAEARDLLCRLFSGERRGSL
jgi:MFS superfamily sulfate permease-like transporter